MAKGWPGAFYPKGLPQREYLSYYSRLFDTVEVDSTLYGTPALTTVKGWYSKTPKGFVFTAKVPNTITHEKVLHDCEAEMTEFLKVMDALAEKLGPLLLQFAYFHRNVFIGVNDFLDRLLPFLDKLPKDRKFAVEIRNKDWLVPHFVEALRERGVALALIDHNYMPRPREWFDELDPITGDFTYVRWLGDRRAIEARTKVWNELIVDRSAELSEWVQILDRIHQLKIPIYAYANNHYAGYGPATVEMVRNLWGFPAKQEVSLGHAPTLFPT